MKRIIYLFATILIFSISGCYRVTPNADEESVLVEKPFLIGHGGVDPNPVYAGAEWVSWTTDHVEFPTTPITYKEEFKDMMTHDKNSVTFYVYFKLHLHKGQSPALYQGFGQKWYENSLQETYRTFVRDIVSPYPMTILISERDTSLRIQNTLFETARKFTESLKLPMDLESVVVGTISPSEAFLKETQNTAAMVQSKITQDARSNAEIARRGAEENRAIADMAYKNKMGLNNDDFIRLRNVEVTKELVEELKDRKDPTTLLFNMGSGVSPSYNIR